MGKRGKYCWIVELSTPRGWEPCYESEVNSSKAWADENRKALQKRYSASKYRVAKYNAAPK